MNILVSIFLLLWVIYWIGTLVFTIAVAEQERKNNKKRSFKFKLFLCGGILLWPYFTWQEIKSRIK